MKKRLRSGFTTGACAAAAAKAAVELLLSGKPVKEVEIPFPDTSRKRFIVANSNFSNREASASIIKDAGDDPDVTNGAEIRASARFEHLGETGPDRILLGNILLCRGAGVGTVTKPGLAIAPGEPAINPIPRIMICRAVEEVCKDRPLTITVSVCNGEALAEKTLNSRLGIIGGISILGTTGIVRPISADAWTATIKASLDVAKEAGLSEVVLSTGRSSERGAQQFLQLPDEAYAMMGDYLDFSLREVKAHGFRTLHLAGMWAKIMKGALRIPQTHVRNGALEIVQAVDLLAKLGADAALVTRMQTANTAREILTRLEEANREDLVKAVCLRAKEYCAEISGCNVHLYLVDHKSRVIAHV